MEKSHKFKWIFIFVLCISSISILSAQNKKVEVFERNKVSNSKIPDSVTSSAQKIADYLNLKFQAQEDKSKAIFEWLARNIRYDYENKYHEPDDLTKELIVSKILLTRKGVCRDYSILFETISEKAGIETHSIAGYTCEGKMINYEPHAWCVCLIDSNWYFMDPTWGAILTQNDNSGEKINLKYFKVEPKHFIKTHIPYDPLWQFLYYPITKNDFKARRYRASIEIPYFNYIDTLKVYEAQAKFERLKSMYERIKNNGITSYLNYDFLYHLNEAIASEQFNEAYLKYSEGIVLFNEYIRYKNNYYAPYKGDVEIKEMLEEISVKMDSVFIKLEAIEHPSEIVSGYISHLEKVTTFAKEELNIEAEKLDNYLKVAKDYRQKLSQKKKNDPEEE